MKRISQRKLKELHNMDMQMAFCYLEVKKLKEAYEEADAEYQQKVAEYRDAYDKAYA